MQTRSIKTILSAIKTRRQHNAKMRAIRLIRPALSMHDNMDDLLDEPDRLPALADIRQDS